VLVMASVGSTIANPPPSCGGHGAVAVTRTIAEAVAGPVAVQRSCWRRRARGERRAAAAAVAAQLDRKVPRPVIRRPDDRQRLPIVKLASRSPVTVSAGVTMANPAPRPLAGTAPFQRCRPGRP
jgi:hypothetical protein